MHVCQHYNSGTNKINSFNFLITLVSFPCMHILREPLEYLCSKQERINITTKEPTTWGNAAQNLLILYGQMPNLKQSNFQ